MGPASAITAGTSVRLVPEEIPNYERLVPGNRKSMRRWAIGLCILYVGLWTFVESGFYSWWVAVLVTPLFIALVTFVRGVVPGWIARKVDPFKGTAPGDKLPPTFGSESRKPRSDEAGGRGTNTR